MKNNYQARLFAPDGESVTDCAAPTVAEVWENVNNIGSRWIFYPLPVVVKIDSDKKNGRIIDVCDGLAKTWRGRTCGIFSKALARVTLELQDRIETTRQPDIYDIVAAL